VHSGGLEKTQAEVLIYANTQAKLNEIISQFILLRAENERLSGAPKGGAEVDRETINRRLNETIFDDEYLERKARKLASRYKDEYGNIRGEQV